MVAELRKIDQSLYETDYNLWVLETVEQLRSRDLDALDWENLIEEVEALSRRDKKKVRSLLKRLLEHLLKLEYWHSELLVNRNHWQGEVQNFRQLLRYELDDSPSLKPYLAEVFAETYQDALEVFCKKSGLPSYLVPTEPSADLERILDKTWFPPRVED
jgi:hypothetical protein